MEDSKVMGYSGKPEGTRGKYSIVFASQLHLSVLVTSSVQWADVSIK